MVKITVLPEDGEIPEGAFEAAPAIAVVPESPEADHAPGPAGSGIEAPVEGVAPEVPEETPAEVTDVEFSVEEVPTEPMEEEKEE